jgi:hypothetical protein
VGELAGAGERGCRKRGESRMVEGEEESRSLTAVAAAAGGRRRRGRKKEREDGPAHSDTHA